MPIAVSNNLSPQTSTIAQPQFPDLVPTSNNLHDIIRWIKEGNIVVLHTTEASRAFHAISDYDPEMATQLLQQTRVIYIDCNSHGGLLGEGEWEYFIKESIENVQELPKNDPLRNLLIEQKLVPHIEYMSLGY